MLRSSGGTSSLAAPCCALLCAAVGSQCGWPLTRCHWCRTPSSRSTHAARSAAQPPVLQHQRARREDAKRIAVLQDGLVRHSARQHQGSYNAQDPVAGPATTSRTRNLYPRRRQLSRPGHRPARARPVQLSAALQLGVMRSPRATPKIDVKYIIGGQSKQIYYFRQSVT